jgi:hypothetical protein
MEALKILPYSTLQAEACDILDKKREVPAASTERISVRL